MVPTHASEPDYPDLHIVSPLWRLFPVVFAGTTVRVNSRPHVSMNVPFACSQIAKAS